MDEHNVLYQQGKTTWEMGITKFTDWTDEEYKSTLTLQKSSMREITGASKSDFSSTLTIPDAIDWREQGQVTGVKDQGNCGASWAFSIAGSVEAAYYRKSGNLVPLSAQELVDCTSEVGNQGCKGGYLRETMPYAAWHGLESEASYPYEGKELNSSAIVAKIDTFKYYSGNQYALEQVIGNIGPVSASIDASGMNFYQSGIYDSENCDYVSPNVGVLVVGYGSENGTNYWIVKNCYGTDWGEDGYIRILHKPSYMACALYYENVYPIIY